MKKLGLILVLLVLVLNITNIASAQYSNLPGSGWWSGQQVQNVGDMVTDINIVVYDKDIRTDIVWYEAVETVLPGAAFTFTPFTSLPLVDKLQGSAVVFADQPIKAIVNVTNNRVVNPQMGISVGIEGGTAAAQYQGIELELTADTLYFPLVKGGYYNNTTTFYVQNAGESYARFLASFMMANGDRHTFETPSIEPERIAVFSVFDSDTFILPPLVTNSLDAARLGSLIVTSNVPMAGVVMEHATAAHPAKVIYSTRGFTENDFDTRAYAPVIKDMFYGAFTGLQVQNVEAINPIDVQVTYYVAQGPNAGEIIVQTKKGIPAGAAHTFVQLEFPPNNSPLPMSNLASVVIESIGGRFVAVVNETNGNATAGITYSALPDRRVSRKISAPLFKDYYYGATSGIQIQNVGTITATNIVAEFTCSVIGGGSFTARSRAQVVAPGKTVLFYRPSGSPQMFEDNMPFVAGHANCAVTVTSDQNIVAIVNEMGVNDGPRLNFGIDDNNYEAFNLFLP